MADPIHVCELDLLGYVDGSLTGEPAEQLERHVAACTGCAARLHEVARTDAVLTEVAIELERHDRPRPPSTLRTVAETVTSVAAVLLLAVHVDGFALPSSAGAGLPVSTSVVAAEHEPAASADLAMCIAPTESGDATCDDSVLLASQTLPEGPDLCDEGPLVSEPTDELAPPMTVGWPVSVDDSALVSG